MVNEGALQYQQNHNPEALGCFMKAIMKVSKRNKGEIKYSSTERLVLSVAWANSAAVLRAQGLQVAGETCLMQALSLVPNNGGLHLDLGDLYQGRRDCRAATAHYAASVQLEEEGVTSMSTSGIFYKAGLCFTVCGRTEEAQMMYSQATALNPTMWQAYVNLGALSLMHRGNAAAPYAEHVFQKAIRIQPDLADAHKGLAIAQQYKLDGAMTAVLAQTSLHIDQSHTLAMIAADENLAAKREREERGEEAAAVGNTLPELMGPSGEAIEVSAEKAILMPRHPRWQYNHDRAMIDILQGKIADAVGKLKEWKSSRFRKTRGMAGMRTGTSSCRSTTPHLYTFAFSHK
jgi:tetratricopeptide (TPR) repeat protein